MGNEEANCPKHQIWSCSQASYSQVSHVRSLQSSALAETKQMIFNYLMLTEVCYLHDFWAEPFQFLFYVLTGLTNFPPLGKQIIQDYPTSVPVFALTLLRTEAGPFLRGIPWKVCVFYKCREGFLQCPVCRIQLILKLKLQVHSRMNRGELNYMYHKVIIITQMSSQLDSYPDDSWVAICGHQPLFHVNATETPCKVWTISP